MEKLRFVILGVIVLIVLGAAGYFILGKQINSPKDNLTIYKDSGTASYKSGKDFVEVTSEKLSIPNHSEVKTSADGLAHVILPDGSMISLAENTQMKVNYDPKSTQILQSLGSAWFRIKKLVGSSEFNVETSTSVATVRGTIFAVETGLEDTVYVTQSSVDISQFKDESGQKTKQNTQSLKENKLSKIGKIEKGSPKITDIPDSVKKSAWFRRNELINKEFDQGITDGFVKKLHDNPQIQQIDQELQTQRQSSNPGLFGQFTTTKWTAGGAEACTYINSAEYNQAISQLSAYSSMLGNWGTWLQKAVDLTKNACRDNIIDENEATQLQNFYQTQPQQPTFTLPQ
ncbi:FecR family protein [Candidatus Microgenomates bacterium]|nr:FecR family protein [Candidatus Microgenomates bacterium]